MSVGKTEAAAAERDAIRLAYAYTLRALRRRIGLAQERMAHEVGVDRAYTSGLERGLHTPTLETVIRFLPYLQVSFREFAAEYEEYLQLARRDVKKAGAAKKKAEATK